MECARRAGHLKNSEIRNFSKLILDFSKTTPEIFKNDSAIFQKVGRTCSKTFPHLFILTPWDFSRVAHDLPCQVVGNPPRRAVRGGGRWDGAPPSFPALGNEKGGQQLPNSPLRATTRWRMGGRPAAPARVENTRRKVYPARWFLEIPESPERINSTLCQ